MPKRETTVDYSEAVRFCAEGIDDIVKAADIPLHELIDFEFHRLLLHFTPGIEFVECSPIGSHYVFADEQVAGYLGGAAQFHDEAVKALRFACAMNVFAGAPLPYLLRTTASQIIRGDAVLAKMRKGPASSSFGRRLVAYATAKSASLFYGFNLTFNEAASNSASEIASDALERFDIDISPSAIRDAASHRKSRQFRLQADSFLNVLNDLSLFKAGGLKRLPPYGLLGEYVRMTKS